MAGAGFVVSRALITCGTLIIKHGFHKSILQLDKFDVGYKQCFRIARGSGSGSGRIVR